MNGYIDDKDLDLLHEKIEGFLEGYPYALVIAEAPKVWGANIEFHTVSNEGLKECGTLFTVARALINNRLVEKGCPPVKDGNPFK